MRTGTYGYLRGYVRSMADLATLIQLARIMRPKIFSGLYTGWQK